jgi:hypothetical protein
MLNRTFERRVKRAEQSAKAKGRLSDDCICFPPNEQPFFGFPIEEKIAAKVRCPLHGERFMHFLRLYVPPWRRESEKKRWPRLSQQYHKAWYASFPPDLWPAEEELVNGIVALRLKDGTLLPSS